VAAGQVTALNQSITASDEGAGTSENLTGMIQTNADIQAGDSGGPLVNDHGQVVGMDTAASSSFQMGGSGQFGGFGDNGGSSSNSGQGSSGSTTQGFSIPINTALTIANQIESGNGTSTVHIGQTAFLGLEISGSDSPYGSGVLLAGAASGTAAANAGLTQGDLVTSVGGQQVTSSTDVQRILVGHHPGDKISIGWTDASGQTHTATVTLTSGPAA
jgi:S1-C subfamily serine protease